jgi:vitamin B12 transporter
MDRPNRRLVLAFALAAMGTTLIAEDMPGYELGEVSITATRIPESPGAAPPAISIVDSSEIESRGAKTAAEAIKVVPGLAISDYGPSGAQKLVSIRGSTTNEVLVLVDGVRVNNSMSGLADLAGIGAENIDRIEVLREGGSALYGGDAVGGVVNIITKKKPSPFVLSFENSSYLPESHVLGYGFAKSEKNADPATLLDSQKIAFSWAPALGDVVFRSSGSFTKANNAYTFSDANGERRMLENADSLGGCGSFGLTFPFFSGNLAADLSGSRARTSSPGPQSSPTPDAEETDTSGRASVRYSSDRFLSDSLGVDLSLHCEYSKIDYVDGDNSANDGRHEVGSAGADLQQKAFLSDAFSLVYGASYAHTRATSDTVGSPSREAAGAFLEPAIEAGAFSLRPALRFDYYSDFFTSAPLGGLGASIAVAYRLSSSDSLKLNVSRSYRVPTFEDLYWPASGGVEGNDDLKPESAYAGDIGFERRSDFFLYKATAYVRFVEDVILWQECSDAVWRPSNYGEAFYPGLEQELDIPLSDRCKAGLNYSYLHSYILSGDLGLSDDRRVPMTPVHGLNGTLAYDAPKYSWSATAKYASLRYLKTANSDYLPGHFTMDATVKWKFSEHCSAYFAADNLFDEQYEIVANYPMPGTKLRIGAEIRI